MQISSCLASGLLDRAWYAANNPDVVAANMDPGVHFVRYGLAEHRKPCPWFQWDRHEAMLRDALDWSSHPRGVAAGRRWSWRAKTPAPTNDLWDGRMDRDYGCPTLAWARFRERWGASYPAREDGLLGRLVVCLGNQPATGQAWRRTLDSLAVLDRPRGMTLRVVRLAGGNVDKVSDIPQGLPAYASPKGLAAALEPEDRVLCLFPGDAVERDLLAVLDAFGAFGADLALCDMSFEEEGRVYPWLLHGCDAVHARYADYHLSRFVIRAGVLSGGRPGEGLTDLVRILLEAGQGVHVPLPVLRIALTRSQVQERKLTLLGQALQAKSSIRSSKADTGEPATVSVVICTRNGGHMLGHLVRRLQGEPQVKEIVIVSNNSDDRATAFYCQALATQGRVTILAYDRPFNFSAQCNLGARHATGTTLFFLNDDILPVTSDWLERLLSTLADHGRETTVVGPLLMYPDYTVQQAGMFLGFRNEAGHALRHARLTGPENNFFLQAPRQVSCLTGAALLLSRRVFADLDGFDPALATYLQDVDFALRLRTRGLKMVFEPRSVLFHFESVSVRQMLSDSSAQQSRALEHHIFAARWGTTVQTDPWMSPLLDLQDESLRSLRTEISRID